MTGRIGGQRPRPRVALLGSFSLEDVEYFRRMFPTIWEADDYSKLVGLVDVREIDLLIIASGIDEAGDWPTTTHVVCFSDSIDNLPGPYSETRVMIVGVAETEEFLFPGVPLVVSRCRDLEYDGLTSVRGWPRLVLRYHSIAKARLEAATAIFNKGAIICELHTMLPLAVAFVREDTGLGVSWLPRVHTNQAAWVDVLVTQWAQHDNKAFPSFGDWTRSAEWMVARETRILSDIAALEDKKQKSVTEINAQIGSLERKLASTIAETNNGLRRLITAQGPELVDEVAKALEYIGFSVTVVDKLVGDSRPKKEDLRLGYVSKRGKEWNAIIEVRGYTKSGGTTSDLQRLHRFADLYHREIGKAPDKRIYIVNGQIELPPSQRQEPLASAADDLEIFSDSGGILIWSIDLFRALRAIDSTDIPVLLDSIMSASGRWTPMQISSSK